jgi:hypothetical protein
MGTTRQPIRLLAEFDRIPSGRLEGRIRTASSQVWTPFSGVLELLKVLEELVECN